LEYTSYNANINSFDINVVLESDTVRSKHVGLVNFTVSPCILIH